ncbi:MAG: phosphomannomutase/phosphoglucomutase [Bacteroidales bacterium]
MKGFKAYDIRGIFNSDFNSDDVYSLGYFLPELSPTNKVLVGRDVRESSDEIFESLLKGLTDRGVDVYDVGLATTPMVYYLTGKYDFKLSVQITASHNPKEYNGFKISGEKVLPIGFDNGLNKLQELVHSGNIVPADKKGARIDFNVTDEYVKFLRNYIPGDLSSLKIGIDCSNGMAGLFIKELLGDQPHYINLQPDGRFPNHEPNPLEPDNQKDIKALVMKEQCDIGVIFDGDGDRVMFIDEHGEFISSDLIIAFMGHYFLTNPGEKVLQDIRSSKSVQEYLEKFQASVYTWKVGRAYAAPRLKEIDGIYGGELAGHYYFKDFYYSDSGIMAALIVLGISSKFKKQGKPISSIIGDIKNYTSSGEINFKIEEKLDAIEAVKDYYIQNNKPLKILDFDGYRLEFADWWFNIRPSNTEPYLRLIVEAKNEELLNLKVEEIKKLIRPYF